MTKRIRMRTLLMGGIFTLLFVGIIFRVYWVQVVKADFWADRAMSLWITKETIRQERGMIVDRDGKVLAVDAAAYTIAVGPKQIADLDSKHPELRIGDQIANKLSEVLGTDVGALRGMVGAEREDGTLLEQREVRPGGWKIDKAVKEQLEEFRTELRKQAGVQNVGLYFIEEKKRSYPNGSLASHILGYENLEGIAISGLEKSLDAILSGEPGYIKYQKDGKRNQLPNGKIDAKQAVDGKNVMLTIDTTIQFYIEEALRKAYDQYKPLSATAIAADPSTMEILGMASFPDFDPNKYWDIKDDAHKNHAIQSLYEPGSTFKIVTLAGAVEENYFDPDAMYKSGVIKYTEKDRPVRDHNYVGWGTISYLEGLKHSSNVAFVKLGYQMLGKEKLTEYIRNFGFGIKTGIELPNEVSRGFSLDWPSEVATAAFGQGKVLVTPIQQVAAVAAVANGGKLMEPHIIKSVTDPATGDKQITEPKLVRQVISPETSATVNGYLEQVVSDLSIGTGRRAYIPGYEIAGKTGTAQKVAGSSTGEYSTDKYVVSFIGYAPVKDPKIVLLVILDEPQAENVGGGAIAAPIFKEIMGQSLLYLGVTPNLTKEEQEKLDKKAADQRDASADVTVIVPEVMGMTTARAEEALKKKGFPVSIIGKGDKVLEQLPKGNSAMPTSQRIYLLTAKQIGSVPDLTGLSLRDALEMCGLLGFACTVEGQGYVVDQKAVKNGDDWSVHLILRAPGQDYEPEPNETDESAENEAQSSDE